MNEQEAIAWIRERVYPIRPGDEDQHHLRSYASDLVDRKRPTGKSREEATRWLRENDAPQGVIDFLVSRELWLTADIVGYSLNAPMIWGEGYVLRERLGRVYKEPMPTFLRERLRG